MDICNSGHLQIPILTDAEATSIVFLRRWWWAEMLLDVDDGHGVAVESIIKRKTSDADSRKSC